jgi:hypothetical protein
MLSEYFNPCLGEKQFTKSPNIRKNQWKSGKKEGKKRAAEADPYTWAAF